MAGTLSYRLQVDHVYQRRFDSDSLAEALETSHWYIIARRPAVKVIQGSARTDDQILTVDIITRDDVSCPARVRTLGADFSQLGELRDFRVYEDGAYFSVRVNGQLIHGDAWALASLLSGASCEIAKQEVLYIGQAFGRAGEGNAWKRVQNHKKLQRIYEDHVATDYEIFVAPLSCERAMVGGDDHIEDAEPGPDLDSYYHTLALPSGEMRKAAVDLIEHSLISYFVPHYNEQLKEWKAVDPTAAMRKMRSAGFRLLNVHLRGWWGLARFYSAQEPNPVRSHFIAQDLPSEPRRPVLRGIAAGQMCSWRFDATLAREGKEIYANLAEQTGTSVRVFGDEAPAVRKPPGIEVQQDVQEQAKKMYSQENIAAHNEIRKSIHMEREKERQMREPLPYTGEQSYDASFGTIAVGECKDGAPSHVRLHDPDTGYADSVLILGNPRSGKSNLLRVIMHQAYITSKFFIIPSDPADQAAFREVWIPLCGDKLVATDIKGTIRNLESGVQVIEARRAVSSRDVKKSRPGAAWNIFRERAAAGNYYTKPSRKIPAVLIGIDNADTVLMNLRGAHFVEQILAFGGPVGVGIALVVSDISTLESDSALVRRLISSSNVIAYMPDGEFVIADLRARRGEPRSYTWREEGPSFVVHSGPSGSTLELVTAVADPELGPSDAQSWAAEQLKESGVSHLLDWKLADGDPRSWWTMDPIKAQRWSLRRHHDGWVLMLLISNDAARPGPDTLRWATEAIKSRYEANLSPWRAGPTTGEDGLSAIYADVLGDITAKDRSEAIKQFLLSRY